MSRYLYTILLCSLFFSATAQDDDSLFVVNKSKSWVMPYTTGRNETVFMVARRFHVPPAVLGTMNNIDFKSTFPQHTQITVPISAYNFMREKMNDMNDALPLYYRVSEDDDLLRICHISGVSQQVMERWNNLTDNNIYIGQALFVGWILYDATSGNKGIVADIEKPVSRNNPAQKKGNELKQNNTQQKPDPESQWPVRQKETRNGPTIVPDPPVHNTQVQTSQLPAQFPAKKGHDTIFAYKRNVDSVKGPALEALYLTQTNNGVDVAMEKGSVAFFNAGSSSTNVYYALHNDIARGVIIKVHNPGNDKMVYAKVIGTLPATRQYYNCIMALSANAKEDLGVKEDKTWCEISYSFAK